MILVYGTDWCEDTRRVRRHLRRLAVAHLYRNIDDDLDALDWAKTMNEARQTPMVDLGVGGTPLIEPDNDTLTGALLELEMLTREEVHERMGVQNVGDLERVARTLGGVALLAAASGAPRLWRTPIRLLGAAAALTGAAGWCPVYQQAGVTSLGGPGDRPTESTRDRWVATRPTPSGAPGRLHW